MPSIAESDVAGTNANSAGATSVTLSYNHPGGLMVVFARHFGDISGNASCTFNGATLTKVQTGEYEDIVGYLFIGDVAAANDTITVDFDGNSKTQRGIMAFSISGEDGYRDADVGGINNAGSGYSITQTPTIASGDLGLQYIAWRNSISSVDSYDSGQSSALSDDSPTRQNASSMTATSSSDSLSTLFDSNAPGDLIAFAVTIKPSATAFVPAPSIVHSKGVEIY